MKKSLKLDIKELANMVQTHRELLLSVGLLVRMVQMQRGILCTLRK